MKFNLSTLDLLKVLDENPTYKGINELGHTLELKGEEKKIIHKKVRQAKRKHVTLSDKWRIVKPIDYDKANDLFKRLRTIECRMSDGTRRFFRKTPVNGHVIIESGLPKLNDKCLYYCLSYVQDQDS